MDYYIVIHHSDRHGEGSSPVKAASESDAARSFKMVNPHLTVIRAYKYEKQ